ncbi:hypothetical protein J437_LFUL013170 [Ladona fulva]|uniref:SWI/SNF-related matrix-associated actin-dependent regulator of chromatin subfamily A-like protein 1 n=1 Tax=Ladona fulva TaxID=123851 RepID=A0A8K0P2H0_LADFU|nr:hypothetical protein J437_LFUL013170 [Ladona fulva]
MSELTDEQRQRMERNRLEALRKRAAKASLQHTTSKPADVNSNQAKKFKASFDQSKGVNLNANSTMSSGAQSTSLPAKFQSSFYSKANVTGHCKLITKDRFSVEIGYHEVMVKIFKTIPSALYDPPSRTWNFNLQDHGKLLTALSSLKNEVSVSPLPATILEIIFPSTSNFYQTVKFGISKGGRCLIADEMGLGKTIQALGIANFFHQDWPLLIVCPSSVKYTWKEAISTWLPSISGKEDITVISNSKEDFTSGNVVIMSFDMFSRSNDKLLRFKTVIVDESHSLKNIKSARSQVAFNILRQAKRVIMLSGTPALSRPIELYPQLACIDRFGFPRMKDFGIRYCNGKSKPWGWDYSGASNMEELFLLLEKRIMIRRLKADVMEQLPAKTSSFKWTRKPCVFMRKCINSDSTIVFVILEMACLQSQNFHDLIHAFYVSMHWSYVLNLMVSCSYSSFIMKSYHKVEAKIVDFVKLRIFI